ncbi:NAD-dependent epimerase/dehydratase family protein [Anaerococcus sp. Marseille-Q5996]|uniref:NAD-dependent epimerase/dehydratase family protein n=1 Tax=Anaerococcus sp. Marseille-Q5996 TaxID=2972769 RepID=UPI0021C9F6D5|nr:NAD(P)-dependent oxidoreductase [Anaerococcus sp. Marseille-Q5996]
MNGLNKIFVLGGAGFLGYHTIKEAVDRGYAVRTVDVVDLPDELKFNDDANVDFIVQNFFALSDAEIVEMIRGCDSFVYAGGVDERIVPEKPARKFFYDKNVLPTERIARLAKEAGVKNFVLFGSYTSEFAEKNEYLRENLYQEEPYVETRLLQEKAAMYAGEGAMNVSVLRLPQIFGTMPGKVPLWSMFVDMLRNQEFMPVTSGGFATITASAVGQAAISALENGKHRKTYAVATGYISYEDFYKKILEELGQTETTKLKVMSFEDLEEAYKEDEKLTDRQGIEHGIRQVNMLRANSMEFKIPTSIAYDELRVREENAEAAIDETLRASNFRNVEKK